MWKLFLWNRINSVTFYLIACLMLMYPLSNPSHTWCRLCTGGVYVTGKPGGGDNQYQQGRGTVGPTPEQSSSTLGRHCRLGDLAKLGVLSEENVLDLSEIFNRVLWIVWLLFFPASYFGQNIVSPFCKLGHLKQQKRIEVTLLISNLTDFKSS